MTKVVFPFILILLLLACNKTDRTISKNLQRDSIIAETKSDLTNNDKVEKERIKNFLTIIQTDSIDQKPIAYYLNNPNLNILCKKLYNGEFKVIDNNETFDVLKVISQKNDTLYPFYFHCLSSICKVSDGALSEAMGEHCFEMVYNYPVYCFKKFAQQPKLMDSYCSFIGFELSFQTDNTSTITTSYAELKKHLCKKLNLNDFQVKTTYESFIKAIEVEFENLKN